MLLFFWDKDFEALWLPSEEVFSFGSLQLCGQLVGLCLCLCVLVGIVALEFLSLQ